MELIKNYKIYLILFIGMLFTKDFDKLFKKEMFKVLYNKPPKIRSSHYINQSINHDKIQKNYLI